MKKLILLVLALLALASAMGCMYSGAVWNTKNNKMYVTKNGLNGLIRAVYECTPSADSFGCVEMPDKP